MSIETLVPLIALTSIGFLVWLAYAWGFRGGQRIADEAELFALSRPYGGAQLFMLDTNGASAIALLNDGQLMAAKTVGDRITTRVFPKTALVSIKLRKSKSDQHMGIELRFADVGFSSVRVEAIEGQLPAWLHQLKSDTGKP